MKQDAFTLIELVIVVSIIIILTVALGFQFTGWMARYNVESQIKTMHVDLMTARQRAMEKNIQYVVQVPALNGNSYVICEDANGNGICDAPAETTNSNISQALSKSGLRYPVNSDLGGAPIIMNQKGLLMVPQGGVNTNIVSQNIWLGNPDTGNGYYKSSDVDYDCISLSATRIYTGKYDYDGNQTSCKTQQICCAK